MKQYPTQNEIKEWFEYRDGELYWKVRKAKNTKIGQRAGRILNVGYRQIVINYNEYMEHRLIWIYFNGDIPDGLQIDHINRVKDDNRIENLRAVSPSMNCLNTNAKNVVKSDNSYRAYYTVNGQRFSQFFDTEQKAIDWVAEKKSEIFEKSGARLL